MVTHEVEREVFEACRSVFTGPSALVRSEKKIRKVLRKGRASIQQLLQKYSLNVVADVAHTLLKKRVFESNVFARVRFPELFETNAAIATQHVALRSEAVRVEVEAEAPAQLDPEPAVDDEDVFFSDDDDNDSRHGGGDEEENKPFGEIDAAEQDPSQPLSQQEATDPPAEPGNSASSSSNALSTVYLPYQIQHRILTTAQTMLEQTCFAFAQRHLPQILVANHWDCAEAVELTQWTETLAKHWRKLHGKIASVTSTLSTNSNKKSTSAISNPKPMLQNLRILRNTAVHRVRAPAPMIHTFLTSAASLAASLHDGPLAVQLNRAAEALEVVTKETQADRAIRKARLDAELGSVEAERAELDRRERAAFDAFEEGEGKAVVENGAWLDGRVKAIFSGSDEPELGSDDNGGEEEEVRSDGKGKDAGRTATRNSVFGVVQSLVGIASAWRV